MLWVDLSPSLPLVSTGRAVLYVMVLGCTLVFFFSPLYVRFLGSQVHSTADVAPGGGVAPAGGPGEHCLHFTIVGAP